MDGMIEYRFDFNEGLPEKSGTYLFVLKNDKIEAKPFDITVPLTHVKGFLTFKERVVKGGMRS